MLRLLRLKFQDFAEASVKHMQVYLLYRLVCVVFSASLASLLTDLAALILAFGELVTQLLIAFFDKVFELVLYEK